MEDLSIDDAPVRALPDVDEDDSHDATLETPAVENLHRLQKQLFDRWLTSEDIHDTVVRSAKDKSQARDVSGMPSTQQLLSDQTSRIITSPRQYQLDLFERAKTQNTIAVLATGSGKTLIAVLLLWYMIDQEVERRASSKQHKISFFLVPSVPLAYQQYTVLERNIDHPITRVTGSDGTDQWQRDTWADIFRNNKVIVCTADILQQCLACGYILMTQINLIIFDEAHHAKKNHAYARIIKDFYITLKPDAKPRIFGMTASPVDGNDDVLLAAMRLESLLDAKIATSNDAVLSTTARVPHEEVLYYPPSSIPQPSPFSQNLEHWERDLCEIKHHIQSARGVTHHLGTWCGDQYLADCLSGQSMTRVKCDAELDVQKGLSSIDPNLEITLQRLQQVEDEVIDRRGSIPAPDASNMSSKVATLFNCLINHFQRLPTSRCLVFVKQRRTARLLAMLSAGFIQTLVRASYLIGFNPSNEGGASSFRDLIVTLHKFRQGELNCLFVTSVAEEGLDISDCNLVIRFDLYNTMIQFVQSRGRARQAASIFVHMLESGNAEHSDIYAKVKLHEVTVRQFCANLPEDRLITGHNEVDIKALWMDKESALRTSTDPVTGAKLTYGNALTCLDRFIATVTSQQEDQSGSLEYIVSRTESLFVAEVQLPRNAPFRSMRGRPQTRITLAKRSAAFDACLELRRLGFLDAHFVSIITRRLPVMRNAVLSKNCEKRNQYEMLLKPERWKLDLQATNSKLYILVIQLVAHSARSFQPIILLTRSELPHFPTFPVYLDDDTAVSVESIKVALPVAVDADEICMLTAFTFRIFRDVFSKTYQEDCNSLPYWLAPSNSSLVSQLGQSSAITNAKDIVDWNLLGVANGSEDRSWSTDLRPADLIGRFITNSRNGGRKFYTTRLADHLSPFDVIPNDGQPAKAGHNICTVLENSIGFLPKQFDIDGWETDQPVVQAEIVSLRRDTLSRPEQPLRPKLTYICLQPLLISIISMQMAMSLYFWPGIIHRFESYMLASEACELVGIRCPLELGLAAITKNSEDHDSNASNEQVRVVSGMGESYERLEFLGDTFLKMATSISCYVLHPHDNEFESHVMRMVMLCNANLFQNACDLRMYRFVRSKPFSRRSWYPEGLQLLKGKGSKAPTKQESYHDLSQKTIADVCEALIGAALLTNPILDRWHEGLWDSAVQTVTKFVNNKNHPMLSWKEYRSAYKTPAWLEKQASVRDEELARQVVVEHDYHFQSPRLLRSAFTHPSLPSHFGDVPHYQRLEFLGDALIDMVVVSDMYHRFPDKDPQWLTEHKMAMVSNKFLGALCVELGFHKHLRFLSESVRRGISTYAAELETFKETGGAASLDYWTKLSDPPKCLADMVEAYVGAMFVDSGFDFFEVQRFYERNMAMYFKDMSAYDTYANQSAVTTFKALVLDRFECQAVSVMAKELPAVLPSERKEVVAAAVIVHDRVIASGGGDTTRAAKSQAIKEATNVVQDLSREQFRTTYGCHCLMAGGIS